MPSIDRTSDTPLYQQVYDQIARGIASGMYPARKRLPSIRECARELDVSNTTIELAYQKLTEEGFVQARRGSGYVICEIAKKTSGPQGEYSAAYQEALGELTQAEAVRDARKQPRYDFAYDAVDASAFPFATWARISRDVLFSKGAEAICQYADRQGLCELRQEIAHYLGSEYGLACTAEQVLIMPTTRDLIAAITGLFEPVDTVFVMEDPGYDEVGHKLAKRGYTVRKIPVAPMPNQQEVARILEGADIVFTTPACQFPSNQVMPVELREQLVEWAERTGSYLIDDEYGWEFQTGTDRMPPLSTLDRSGRVITIGTFSNSFSPAICLSYAVLPPQLMLAWQKAERGAHPQVPWQTQAAMAAFMREGHWRTHIRKMRAAMHRKQRALIEALEKHFGDSIEIVPGPTSLFVLVKMRDGREEQELIETAAARDVRVYPTKRYWSDAAPDDWRYVLVGYAGIGLKDIEPGVRELSRAWQ